MGKKAVRPYWASNPNSQKGLHDSISTSVTMEDPIGTRVFILMLLMLFSTKWPSQLFLIMKENRTMNQKRNQASDLENMKSRLSPSIFPLWVNCLWNLSTLWLVMLLMKVMGVGPSDPSLWGLTMTSGPRGKRRGKRLVWALLASRTE